MTPAGFALELVRLAPIVWCVACLVLAGVIVLERKP